MCNRYRENGVDSPVYFARVVILLGYLSLLVLLCGTSGYARISKEKIDGRTCRQPHRALGTQFQLGDANTEDYDKLRDDPPTVPVYRIEGEPILSKRILQGMQRRIPKSNKDVEYGPHDMGGYDASKILKSIILHLIKYPRRLHRAEAKSENYILRANYKPRLGRKRSYSGQK